jgi:hypothetical protein
MVRARTVDLKVKAAKKVMKKQIHSVKKQAKKEQKKLKLQVVSAKKVVKKEKAKNVKQDVEIAKLKADLSKLKKKKKFNTSHVSEYNIFIRKQIKSGLTFLQAVKQWNKYKKLEALNKRRPSAYNQFIGSQMRLGKTWTQAIALWKLAKAGKLGKKGSTRTVTKTIVRRIASKPKIKYRTRTIASKPKIRYRTRTNTVIKRIRSKPKVIVKRVKSKPRVITKFKTRTITKIKKVPSKPIVRTVTKSVQSPGLDMRELRSLFESRVSSSISKSDLKDALNPDSEEIAFKLIQTYFMEVARLGFKRQLTLDEIINAYFYALARVKRSGIEMSEVAEAVKESGMRK